MPPWSLAALLERPLVTGVGFELSWLETIHPQPHDIRMGLIGHRAPVRLYRCEAMGRLVDLIIPEPQRARHWAGFRKVMDTGG